jgi:type II secretory pathway component PulF
MQTDQLKRNASQIYLTLVPFLAAVFGLGVGYVSYKIYLPIWIINVCLMVTATWILGALVVLSVL